MAALDFLKKTPGLVRMGIFLAAGIVLLLLASSGKQTEQEGGDTDLSAYGEALEARLESLCSQVAGVGRAEVMVTFESGEQVEYRGSTAIGSAPPRVLGVTVLCSGGGSLEVRSALCEMLGALLGIGLNRISVLPLAE